MYRFGVPEGYAADTSETFRTGSEVVFPEIGIQVLALTWRPALRALTFRTLDAGVAITRYWALSIHAIS